MADVRHFFADRQVMEVDTPILSQAAPTAPYLDSFESAFKSGSTQQTRYMQTSPEFAMKRLLATGSGAIYQIARVFRNGEAGRHHSPEFVMLEWYQPGFSLADLMAEVDALIQHLLGTPPAVIYSYYDLFAHYLALDVFQVEVSQLKRTALEHISGLTADWQTDRGGWLEMLMSQAIEPQLKILKSPVFVTDFPASQAQLAKTSLNQSGHLVARRFELYAGGMELANGYDELCDATELRRRFERDNQSRQQQNKPMMPIDEHLLSAMQSGLPQCSGVALGLDRLLMLLLNENDISQVQNIPFIDS